MARTPPQAASPRDRERTACRRVTTTCGHISTLVVLACLWPAGHAHAQRTCEQWSAHITAVEGRVEVRRRDNPNWVTLTTGSPVCTGDAVRSQSSSRATITLPDGGTLRLDENSTLGLPEPPSGLDSLVELLRGVIHVISRDPRFLQFTTPYANAGLEGTEFDIRVDENNRFTEIIVLEGEVAVSTPAGELQCRERPCRSRQRGPGSYRFTVRGADRTDALGKLLPADRRSRTPRCRPRAERGRADRRRLLRGSCSGAPGDGGHRGGRSRHRGRPWYRSRQRDSTVAERPPCPRTRRPGGRARASRTSARRRAELGRRASRVVARRAELGSRRGGRPDVARGARPGTRQQHRRHAARRDCPRSRRCAGRDRACHARTELGPDARRPPRRARIRQPPGIRYGGGRERFRSGGRARARRTVAAPRIGTCFDSSRRPH